MRRASPGSAGVLLVLLFGVSAPIRAQMDMQHPQADGEPLGIPEARMGSGTSWVPDATPMHAAHFMVGSWSLMLHGQAFVQDDWQGGPRGSHQLGMVNWVMAAASRTIGGGRLDLRTMLSAEPWTIGTQGYPLLVQSGESYQGAPLHDRQHPHDLFMELAALYQRPITQRVGLSLYMAPVGEPAVGPVAFPHRPSAVDDPLAPISHHWQDGTHVTFGVLSTGLFTRTIKVEASWFNGREPDENRTDFDYRGRRLDSYSGRVTVNPGAHWSLSGWYAYLRSPEGLHPGESLHRFGAAVLTTKGLPLGGVWATSLIYGANNQIGTGRIESSALLESTLSPTGDNSFFGRVEYVRKSAEDLVIPFANPTQEYDIGALALGYLRTLGTFAGLSSGVGLRASVNLVPPGIANVYGSRTPGGVALYVRLRPGHARESTMTMNGMDAISGRLQ